MSPSIHKPLALFPPAILCMVLAATMFTACSRAKKTDESAATPPVTAPSVASPETDAAPPPPPPPASDAASPGEAAPGEAPPSVAQLNSALEQWVFQHNNPPKDLNELVKEGYLKRLPAPPPGKRFSFDPRTMKVTVTD